MIDHPGYFVGFIMLSLATLVTWAFWMLPQWTRPGIYFGVTVQPEFRKTPEARRLLQKYRVEAMIHVAIAFAMILASALPRYSFFSVIGGLWLAVGPLTAFIEAHKRVQRHAVRAATVREAVLEPRSTRQPGGWIVQVGPFAILLGVGLFLHFHWDEIPARFAVHWGVDGQPNGWSSRTPAGVYAPLLLGSGISFCMWLMANTLLRSARIIDRARPVLVLHDFARRVGLFLLLLEFYLAVVFSCVGLLPLTGTKPLSIVTILMLPAVFVLIVWLNKGRTHANRTGETDSAAIGDGTPDECWKFGVLYFNPDDAALWVERRVGIGYTMNFAHISAWVIMALLLLLPLALGLMTLHHR
ncbi:MAG TPA: DUF5808 domain-containing protein [Candidatus Acidoferrales bacterium]